MKKKRRSNNPTGRPSSGLTEGKTLVTGPQLLLVAMQARAQQLGISQNEAWRRAARAWLGWHEVLPIKVS